MKRIIVNLFLVAVFLSFSGRILAQEGAPEGWKSIMQIEAEQYRDFQVSPDVDKQGKRPMDLVPKTSPPSREIFGYLPYWQSDTSIVNNLNYNLLTTIAYFGVDIDGQGNITNGHDWPYSYLINRAHSEGVRVLLTAILFNGTQLSTLLGSQANRTRCINNLVAAVQNANADGVNIDFEGVPSGQRANMTTFMTALADSFHTRIPGSYVSIFSPAVDWSSNFDYDALADVCDALVMQGYDYHWSSAPTSGAVAPLTGYTYNVTWTVNDYLTKTGGDNAKLILSVPYYGFEWDTDGDQPGANTLGTGNSIFYSTAYGNAQQHGRIWHTSSQTPWYRYNNGTWHQGWYDDSLSLALKYNLVNSRDLQGIAIWALGYDGTRLELQGALSDAFGVTAPPLRPNGLYVYNDPNGSVRVIVDRSSGANGYRLYRSADGVSFDGGTDYASANIVLNNLSPDSTYYYKVSAFNDNGESNQTEVLGVRPAGGAAPILVVNGFDRTTGTVNTFNFIRRYAPSIVAAGYRFDAASNEAVISGLVSLANYQAVIWISGEEGTADESFSLAEQQLVVPYLEEGGQLFVSGSEIGYDLSERGTSTDQGFYLNYLKADYVRDQVATHTMAGISGGIFDGLLNLTFDDGTHGTYNVDYPDGINPAGGATLAMTYPGFPSGQYGGAAILYRGNFGLGQVPGAVVYMAVPFETIYPAANRDGVMAAVLQYFNITTGVETPGPPELVRGFHLEQNYPNPFNPETTIGFTLNLASRG
nr:glycosyl hydrolase family 18 protein [Calditrichia bacterium]